MADNQFKTIFTSSIGKKLVMGFTGLFLISFLVVHCSINACIFFNDNGQTFNIFAHFMGTNIIIRTMEIGLFIGIILHIVQGLILTFQNRAKRSQKYAVDAGKANSKWYSRSMGLLGTIILFFLIIHLFHFWSKSRMPGLFGSLDEVTYDGKIYHNLYALMQLEFHEWYTVVIYCIAMISLAYHLLHGFSSAFQTFGLNHKKYTPIIKTTGVIFSIVVPLIFALMPLSIYFGWIQ